MVATHAAAAGVEIPISPAEDESCVGSEKVPSDPTAFIRGALGVLEAAGHDAEAYRLELRHDDAQALGFSASDPGPVLSVVFLPEESERHYPVKVNAHHPCALTWVWQPASFTPWQKKVIEKASELAESRAVWEAGSQLDIRVTESRELIGIEVWPLRELNRESAGPELTILLRKSDLSLVAVRSM